MHASSITVPPCLREVRGKPGGKKKKKKPTYADDEPELGIEPGKEEGTRIFRDGGRNNVHGQSIADISTSLVGVTDVNDDCFSECS